MRTMGTKTWLATILLLLLGLTHAQLGAEISPANVHLTGKPGATLTGTITLRNPTKGPVALQVVPADFVLTPDNRINPLPVDSLPASLAGWLNLGVSNLDLAPGDSREYNYSIAIPPNAGPGTHWGAILFRTTVDQANGSGTGVGMSVRAQVAFIVVLDIAPLKPGGKVSNITMDQAGSTSASQGQTVTVQFQNTGDAYLRLDGRVELRSTDGTLVQTLTLGPTPSFPQQLSDIPAKLTKALDPGTYLATAILNYGGPDLIAGQATVSVR